MKNYHRLQKLLCRLFTFKLYDYTTLQQYAKAESVVAKAYIIRLVTITLTLFLFQESKPDFKLGGDGGARITAYKYTHSAAPFSESAPTSMDQEMDSGEDTPMVAGGTKTKTRIVKVVKKQSNV